jgi:hypothetical protein
MRRWWATDSVDVGEGDLDPLLARQVHASDTRHLALPLFVFGIALADNANHALPLNHLAVLANRLHA